MATNLVKWSGGTSRTSGIANNAINAAARALGDEIDNSTNKDTYLMAELQFTTAGTPVAGDICSLYLIYAFDGTNYGDGDANNTPAKNPDATIPLRAATGAQRVTCPYPIPVLPLKFKPLLINNSGNNATGVYLSLKSINLDIQAPA